MNMDLEWESHGYGNVMIDMKCYLGSRMAEHLRNKGKEKDI